MKMLALLVLPMSLSGCARELDLVPTTSTSSSTDGDTTTSGVEAETAPVAEDTTGSSSDTGPPECGPCPEETPVCDPAGECVACNAEGVAATACAEVDAERPECREDGRCVQCPEDVAMICTSQGLLCDEESGDCVQCREHGQCPSGACALVEGTCAPEDVPVLLVDGDEEEDEDATPPMYASIEAAVAAVADGMTAMIVVHEQAGGVAYQEALQIAGGKTIWLLAAAGEHPILLGTAGNPGLRVEDAEDEGTTVYMEGLRIFQSSGVGLHVTDATVWVDRSQIVQNSGGGIVADKSSPMAKTGATLTVRNSFVGGNGVGDVGSHGLSVDSSDVSVLYTTLARNDESMIDSIFCTGGTVEVRNSIVVGEDAASIDCPGIVISNSAVDEAFGDNANVGAAMLSWFASVAMGDFHLTEEGEDIFGDVARWRAGDPSIDIDGDARPGADRAPDFAGADVP